MSGLPVLTDTTILVGLDRIYGRITCLPANDAARVLAAMAGTKTLCLRTLEQARVLGLNIQVAPGMGTMLEDFMAGRLS